jgi:LmbE family N-acetylglucosaminyl deacetylase
MSRRVLVISAHPDDEALGCGGTLLKHRANGDRLSWMVVTKAHRPQWSAPVIRRKAAEVQQVARAFGITRLVALGLPSAQLDVVPQGKLIERLRQALSALRPEIVYVVSPCDSHHDHRAVFAAVMVVLKPWTMKRLGVKRILSYEVPSSTESAPPAQYAPFVPTWFSEITPFIEQKLQVMRLYRSELQPDPLPRSVESLRALARWRGATIGVPYAEAFILVRELA